jgi:uncharacterized protein
MIFIDTSAFIALYNSKDIFHKKALIWWKNKPANDLITSNIVILETLGWIRYSLGRSSTVDAGKILYDSDDIKIERMTDVDEMKSWQLFQKVEGRSLSMVDCISIVMMERLKIKGVVTFDGDFANLGFKVFP